VIVPAFTAAATPHSVYWLGLTPVFCDIDPLTRNIDLWRVKDLITPRISGILAVNLWGRPCDIEALSDIARRHRDEPRQAATVGRRHGRASEVDHVLPAGPSSVR